MKRLPILILFLIFPTLAWGATYYVNGSTGNNSYSTAQAQNPATPWLTLNGAEAKAADGDTVHVAAGTYAETGGYGWYITKGITWIADGSVIVKCGDASANVFWSYTSTGDFSITGFTFDGEGTINYVINIGSNSTGGSFINCSFLNGKLNVFYTSSALSPNIDLTDCTINSTSTAYCFNCSNAVVLTISGGSVTFTGKRYLFFDTAASSVSQTETSCDLTLTEYVMTAYTGSVVNITGGTFALSGLYLSFIYPAAGSSGTFNLVNTTITLNSIFSADLFHLVQPGWTVLFSGNTITSSEELTDHLIVISSANAPIITGNTITTTTQNDIFTIYLANYTGDASPATITNNTIISYNKTGVIVSIGENSPPVNVNKMNGSTISGNSIYGLLWNAPETADVTSHAILVGYTSNVNVTKNYINGCGYAVVFKHNGGDDSVFTTGGFNYNLSINNFGFGAIRVKGARDVNIYNNTVYVSPSVAGFYQIYVSENGVGEIGSCTIKNNIFSGDALYAIKIADAGSSAISDYNVIYGVTTGNVGGVVATDYETLLNWQGAGYDEHSVSSDPQFFSASNFYIKGNSSARRAGTNVSLTTDYAGIPVNNPPEIGAYQYRLMDGDDDFFLLRRR